MKDQILKSNTIKQVSLLQYWHEGQIGSDTPPPSPNPQTFTHS